MKAILVIDIPDDIWANKEEDMGMYANLWSRRIDDGWCCEYYADNLKPMPKRMLTLAKINNGEILNNNEIQYMKGRNDCIDEILGEE